MMSNIKYVIDYYKLNKKNIHKKILFQQIANNKQESNLTVITSWWGELIRETKNNALQYFSLISCIHTTVHSSALDDDVDACVQKKSNWSVSAIYERIHNKYDRIWQIAIIYAHPSTASHIMHTGMRMRISVNACVCMCVCLCACMISACNDRQKRIHLQEYII